MSAEKYMERAGTVVDNAIGHLLKLAGGRHRERIENAIAALCAEIEAETREAAAKVAEAEAGRWTGDYGGAYASAAANRIAAAIRGGKP